MEQNTTIPSILGPADESARSKQPSAGSPFLKFALWGLLAALAILVFRFVKR